MFRDLRFHPPPISRARVGPRATWCGLWEFAEADGGLTYTHLGPAHFGIATSVTDEGWVGARDGEWTLEGIEGRVIHTTEFGIVRYERMA